MNSSSPAAKTIVVCGGGLAGHMATLSLVDALSNDYRLVQLNASDTPPADVMYGGATSPESYNYLRGLGLDEPLLMLEGRTAFSLGTHFQRWRSGLAWQQCHHAPFPTIDGTPLIHHLTRSGTPLSEVLVSAQAALAGRFAHPPADPASPLALAEYGYQFDPLDWIRLLDARIETTRVERLKAETVTVRSEEGGRTVLALDEVALEADLVIDATGPGRAVISQTGSNFTAERTINAQVSRTAAPQTGQPSRVIEASEEGWILKVFSQETELSLAITSPDDRNEASQGIDIELGRVGEAWRGSCIAIGHAAWTIEPLTPAPMMLLQRDIERLLELIPTTPEASTERREYNRRFRDDVDHAGLFHEAMLRQDGAMDSAYWKSAAGGEPSEKLARKLRQYSHRGIVPRFDLEPFNNEDWIILLEGLGKTPQDYDRQADRLPEAETHNQLRQMKATIDNLVPRMPPHHIYVAKLKQYLEKKRHA